jgi:hypothetical protein
MLGCLGAALILFAITIFIPVVHFVRCQSSEANRVSSGLRVRAQAAPARLQADPHIQHRNRDV